MPAFSFPYPAVPRRWIFLGFLIALHLVFLQGPATSLGRLLFLSHIGIGLLWQPFVQPRRRLEFAATVVVVVFAGTFAYFLGWGLLAIWVMLLTGVVGGKVFLFPDRWERLFHLMALGYLTMAVLALILPQALAGTHRVEPLLSDLVRYLAPAIFLVMAVLPLGRDGAERAEIVDYVYGVFVFLLLAVIVLGSLSFALLFRVGYFEALMMALALVAGILLLLGWIWNPRSGFGGLSSAVAQHVMSLGLPIEEWLQSLADLAKREADPDRFLELACADLPRRLPGVVGGEWHGLTGLRQFGVQQGYLLRFQHGNLQLGLVCRVEPSPTLRWHYDLAARLLAEFHMGKWRARELQRLSYVEAIHETGARLTHDVKNLLQSLETLCVAIQAEGETPSARFAGLLRRQLPEIAARLRLTLNKLAAPVAVTDEAALAATSWFASIEARYANRKIGFVMADDLASIKLDPLLFSSITENLLQNITDKHHRDPAVGAQVCLGAANGKAWLEVMDDGGAIPASRAALLFVDVAPSEHGLGIGLYQSARLARQSGYRLELAENRAGCVRFRLAPTV